MGLRNLHSIVESNVGRALIRLVGRIHVWDEQHWPGNTVEAQTAKLVEEAQEMQRAPRDIGEAADLLIVLLAWLRVSGYSVVDLITAAIKKQGINEHRRWEAGPDGTRKHVGD